MKQYPITLSFYLHKEESPKSYSIRFKQKQKWEYFSFTLKKNGDLKYPLPKTQKDEFMAMIGYAKEKYQLTSIAETHFHFVRQPQEIREYLLNGFVEDGYIYQAKPRIKDLTWVYGNWLSENLEEYFVYRI